MRKYFVCLQILFCCFFSLSTEAKTDSTLRKIHLIGMQASIDIPQADLAKRFGIFDKVGAGYHQKLANNWIVGARCHFIFGNRIREAGFLQNMITSTGGIINNGGLVNGLSTFMRGYNLGVDVGKVLPVWQANANSGLMVLSSFGFMQHKINIFDRDNQFAQLQGDYKKGYDRLTNGLYGEALIGYLFFASKKNINVFAGFNCNVARTGGRRDWWLDVQQAGNDKRWDLSTGFMLCWFVPIYRKKVEEVYY
jgi:hypothetical protein